MDTENLHVIEEERSVPVSAPKKLKSVKLIAPLRLIKSGKVADRSGNRKTTKHRASPYEIPQSGGCSPPPVLIQSPEDVRNTRQYRPLVCPLRPDGATQPSNDSTFYKAFGRGFCSVVKN
jgi:hypothetical protein